MAKQVLFLKNLTVKDEKSIANQNDANDYKRFSQSNFEEIEFSITTNDILLNTPVQVTKDYDAVNSMINDYFSKQYVYGLLFFWFLKNFKICFICMETMYFSPQYGKNLFQFEENIEVLLVSSTSFSDFKDQV
jgi:hypothetical protein